MERQTHLRFAPSFVSHRLRIGCVTTAIIQLPRLFIYVVTHFTHNKCFGILMVRNVSESFFFITTRRLHEVSLKRITFADECTLVWRGEIARTHRE